MSEFGKTIAKFGETLVEAPFSLYDAARYVMDSKMRRFGLEGLEELTEEELEERERIKSGAVRSVIGALGFDAEEGGKIFTEEGKVSEAETIPGAVGQFAGEIGAYAVPFTGITRGARALGLGERFAAPIAGAAITEQLLTDPTENLFNFVEDTFPEASKNTFIEYMAADADDDEINNRMKMIVQDVGLIPFIERGVSFVATLKRMKQSKKFDALSEEEHLL